jgi:hypothetical protein
VTRACRYDPDLNPTYPEFAVHYGMGVVPARPYKPRDRYLGASNVYLCPASEVRLHANPQVLFGQFREFFFRRVIPILRR